jgi:hypothetical protein
MFSVKVQMNEFTLTTSFGFGGSNRTLESVVLGSYVKPISRISWPARLDQELRTQSQQVRRATLRNVSHFIDAIPFVSSSEVLKSWCMLVAAFFVSFENQGFADVCADAIDLEGEG